MNRYIKLEIFCRAGFDLDKQGFEQRLSAKLDINCIYAKSSVHKNLNQGTFGVAFAVIEGVCGVNVKGFCNKFQHFFNQG